MLHEKQSSVEVHVSIQSSGKPIERFLVDDQIEFRHFILYIKYIKKTTTRKQIFQQNKITTKKKEKRRKGYYAGFVQRTFG